MENRESETIFAQVNKLPIVQQQSHQGCQVEKNKKNMKNKKKANVINHPNLQNIKKIYDLFKPTLNKLKKNYVTKLYIYNKLKIQISIHLSAL